MADKGPSDSEPRPATPEAAKAANQHNVNKRPKG